MMHKLKKKSVSLPPSLSRVDTGLQRPMKASLTALIDKPWEQGPDAGQDEGKKRKIRSSIHMYQAHILGA
jgi:hypothetical protein